MIVWFRPIETKGPGETFFAAAYVLAYILHVESYCLNFLRHFDLNYNEISSILYNVSRI